MNATVETTDGAVYGNFTEVLYDGFPVAFRGNKTGTFYKICKRCGGAGEYSFNLMDGTVCYGCSGQRVQGETTLGDEIRKYENRKKARNKKVEAANAKYIADRAVMDKWMGEHAELCKALADYLIPSDEYGYVAGPAKRSNNFLSELASQALLTVRPLSVRQVEAAEKAIKADDARDASRAQADAAKRAAGHYGAIKEKVTAEVTVTGIKEIDGQYGISYLIMMETAEGHSLKTFTTGRFAADAREAKENGEAITIKATVKAHDEYNGTPQTMLLRVSKV